MDQKLTRLSQLKPMLATLKKLHAHFLFQLYQLSAKGGLSNMQELRRFSYIAFPRHRKKILQNTKIHYITLFAFYDTITQASSGISFYAAI